MSKILNNNINWNQSIPLKTLEIGFFFISSVAKYEANIAVDIHIIKTQTKVNSGKWYSNGSSVNTKNCIYIVKATLNPITDPRNADDNIRLMDSNIYI